MTTFLLAPALLMGACTPLDASIMAGSAILTNGSGGQPVQSYRQHSDTKCFDMYNGKDDKPVRKCTTSKSWVAD